MSTVEFWRGQGGDAYTDRNPDESRVWALHELWEDIVGYLPPFSSVVEVGAGTGANLVALRSMVDGSFYGVEPNELARRKLANVAHARNGTALETGLPDDFADLVFTSACLIHIPPDELHKACAEIYRIAKRHIVCIEYFSHEPQEIVWRGQTGLVWKRDFGAFWLDNFPLKPIAAGFAWKRLTGLDNLTYWIFSKE